MCGSRISRLLTSTAALFFGSGLASVYALTDEDFTNTGIVISTSSQFENNDTNNQGTVLVRPKGLAVQKRADTSALSTPTAAGDTVTYTITLDNLGLLGLTGITLDDSIIPAAELSLTSGDTNDDGVLDGDEIWVYTGVYTVQQSDIDTFGGGDGDIDNLVSVSSNELLPVTATAEVAVTQAPGFSVDKRVDSSAIASPGVLSYDIDVSNTGNQTLNGLVLTDILPDGAAGTLSGPSTDVGTAGALDVGETWTYVAEYTVTQADIDAGDLLENTVSVTALETGPNPVEDSAVTSVTSEPELAVRKIVDLATINTPGELVYSVVVENVGNVSLNNVTLVDELPDGNAAVLIGPVLDAGLADVLDVGEAWEFSGSYQVTQADLDSGDPLVNTVRATADETGTDEVLDTAVTAVSSEPAMSVLKQVDLASIGSPGALNYTISVQNTGNVSLTGVVAVDTLPDGTVASLVGPLDDTGLPDQIDVGETWAYAASYDVSQVEIDQGWARVNVVEVTSNETGADAFSDSAQTTITQSPDFEVSKSVDAAAVSSPGPLNYEIVVENTGNTSLTDLLFDDTLPDGTTASLTGPLVDDGLPGVLDVGERWTLTGEYVVTQDDVDAGTALTNTISVSTAEAGQREDTAVTLVDQAPALQIVKVANESDYVAVDDVLTYSLTVSNTGNLVLSDIRVEDLMADAGSVTCDADDVVELLPGEQLTCSASRTIVDSDIASTNVLNQATVDALDPSGNVVDALSNEVIVPMQRLAPVATDDTHVSPYSAVLVTLPGAASDSDENGDLDPSTVSLISADAVDIDGDGDNDVLTVAGEGTWTVNDATGEVSFAPVAGFTADPEPVSYTVSDATGLVSNDALLVVEYPQTAPVAQDDRVVNPEVASPSNPTTLNVLADNGNGADSDPENDIDVTRVQLSDSAAVDSDGDGDRDTLIVVGEGVWSVDDTTGDVTFVPQAGFLGDPAPVAYTVADINGLVSNEALITIDYPQTAPVANDDQRLDQPLAQVVSLNPLDNDTDPEDNIDTATVVLIDPVSGDSVTSLLVEGEGLWSVEEGTGVISFAPETGFLGDPAPVEYTVSDNTGLVSNNASVTVTYEAPASLEGIVWLDRDRDGVVDPDEERKVGWQLRIIDASGELVATAISDDQGYYSVTGLVPGAFTVEFYNESGVFMDSQTTDGAILAGQVVNLPLPVDPGGVVYDSVSRFPVAGVTLNLLNSQDVAVDESCLLESQQGQVTEDDGLYAFNLNTDAHASCTSGDTYRIEISAAPEEYRADYSTIIREAGAGDCGDATLGCALSSVFDSAIAEHDCTIDTIPSSNACEVQEQPDAPLDGQQTQYYVQFDIEAGDRNVIFNHIPIDARANDAEILLSKTADVGSASIGGLVQYTLNAENTKDAPSVDIEIVDTPPAGFLLVPESVQLVQPGPDGDLDTDDDVVTAPVVANVDPLRISGLDIDPLETVRITYLMRVGVGVVSGSYRNDAVASGPNGVASNAVSATVEIVSDPVLEQATLIGKVFHDRDQDGAQDPADATGVSLRSDYFGWNSLSLPSLPGRNTAQDDPAETAVVVHMPLSDNNSFTVLTDEGTRIHVNETGTVSEAHVGAKARGLTGQDIRVCTQHTVDVPTSQDGLTPVNLAPTDVLRIVVQNYGIDESGIPGVRLATVTGLLIETDAYGRYSIPDVDAGSTGIGQNVVLKVDPSSLPQGSRFTTENPYVLRIVSETLNKINFGVLVPDTDLYSGVTSDLCKAVANTGTSSKVEVQLGSVFFDTDKNTVREDQRGIVADIVSKLKAYGGGSILIETHTDSRGSARYNLELAEKRAETIRGLLADALGPELVKLVSVEVNPAAYEEQDR